VVGSIIITSGQNKSMMFRPGDDDVSARSDQAIAALLLAKSGDRESFPAIRRLALSAAGEDKVVLGKAAKLVEGH